MALFPYLITNTDQQIQPTQSTKTLNSASTLTQEKLVSLQLMVTSIRETTTLLPSRTPTPRVKRLFTLRFYADTPSFVQENSVLVESEAAPFQCFPEHTERATYYISEESHLIGASFLTDSLDEYSEFILNQTQIELAQETIDIDALEDIVNTIHTMFREETPQRPGVYSDPIPPPAYLIDFAKTHSAIVGAATFQSTSGLVHTHGIFFKCEPHSIDENGRTENLYIPLDNVVEEFQDTFLALFQPTSQLTIEYPERTVYFNEHCLAVLDESGSNQYRGFYYWALAPLAEGRSDHSDYWSIVNAMIHAMSPEE